MSFYKGTSISFSTLSTLSQYRPFTPSRPWTNTIKLSPCPSYDAQFDFHTTLLFSNLKFVVKGRKWGRRGNFRGRKWGRRGKFRLLIVCFWRGSESISVTKSFPWPFQDNLCWLFNAHPDPVGNWKSCGSVVWVLAHIIRVGGIFLGVQCLPIIRMLVRFNTHSMVCHYLCRIVDIIRSKTKDWHWLGVCGQLWLWEW